VTLKPIFALAFIYSILGECWARPTSEDIYGPFDGSSRDLNILDWLLISAFYGPFLFALLRDKGARRIIFFIFGSCGVLVYFVSNMEKGNAILFMVGVLIFWAVFGERIADHVIGDKTTEANKVDPDFSKNVHKFIGSIEQTKNTVERLDSSISQIPKGPAKVSTETPNSDVSDSALAIINSQRKIYDEGIWSKKAATIKNESSLQADIPVISGVGWKHDKAKKILWNESTGETLHSSSGLGYSYANLYFNLYNKSTPRKILQSEVVEADYV
jgi:hypothetical protein